MEETPQVVQQEVEPEQLKAENQQMTTEEEEDDA